MTSRIGLSVSAFLAVLIAMLLLFLPILSLSGHVLEIWAAYGILLMTAVEAGALVWVKSSRS